MTMKPAYSIALMFVAIFLIVAGVVMAGSLYYKKTMSSEAVPTATPSLTETPAAEQVEPAVLNLSPTDASHTKYQLVVTGLTAPVNGIVFQLSSFPSGAQLTSDSVATDPALQTNGWSTAVNSSNDNGNQALSFSTLTTGPAPTETVPSITIGTITFDKAPTENDLSLNAQESYVTYVGEKIAPLNLVLKTDTMEQ